MRPAVAAAWPGFIARWEGRTDHMYLDTRGYVTFGVGRKIDDAGVISAYGLTRPWRDADGDLVLEAVIAQEWRTIKARTDLQSRGGYAYASIAALSLDGRDIDEALADTTGQFWATLVRSLPGLPEWPADAQLGLANMAYHLGPNFLGSSWPSFTAAARTADFAGCAAHCQTSARTPRDRANAQLFTNAAAAAFAGPAISPEELWGLEGTPTLAGVGPGPLLALTSLSAAALAAAAAKPPTFSLPAFYVQRMLAATGHYGSAIDGLFGGVSRAAWLAWAKAAGQPTSYTAPPLAALSRATLRMPVTA